MSLQDQITADQQAISDAQAALDAANAKLAADRAALEAILPHLDLWQRVEDTVKKYGSEVETEVATLATEARRLLGM